MRDAYNNDTPQNPGNLSEKKSDPLDLMDALDELDDFDMPYSENILKDSNYPDEEDDDEDADDEPYNDTPQNPGNLSEKKSDSLDLMDALDELDNFDMPYSENILKDSNHLDEEDDDEDADDEPYVDYDPDDPVNDEDEEEDTPDAPPETERVYDPEGLYGLDEMDDFDEEDANEDYEEWYGDFQDAVRQFDQDVLFSSLNKMLHESQNIFAVNKKLMQKTIDVSWVEAIENGLVHVDNFLRNPRRTIEDVEEIVPIALSRKITVESIKHLAQHTDLIQSYDKKSGKITPSKILNVHKEESLMTYENKFVNTLIDRLYLFINIRYQKLAMVAKDEQAYSLGYNTAIDDGSGGKFKMEVKLETIYSLDSHNEHGYTVWQRVEKLKRIIEGYKGSELCTKLGSAYIRPPVMRTNAIMKNVDLKACLTLWQYIESYDKAGYEITIEDNVIKPDSAFVEDFYKLVLMNMILFRASMQGEDSIAKVKMLKKNKHRTVKPKFIRYFSGELSDDYSVSTTGAPGYISTDGEQKIAATIPKDADVTKIFSQISQVIAIEQSYQAKLEEERKQQEQAARAEAYRKLEQQRIDRLRKKELERLERQQEEEQRRIEEMLAQKRAEQEAEEKERQRIEQERLALLEEKQKEEEERQKRQDDKQLKLEEQERIDAERQRLAEEKNLVRSELGEAEGVDTDALPEEQEEVPEEINITEEELAEARETMDEEQAEFEDPREVAVRMKLEQQKREKERLESERAARLKAEREYFQNKPFQDIYKEYSRNPVYAIPRFFQWLLVVLFHLIPEQTDNPDWKRMLAEIQQQKEEAVRQKQEKEKMEAFYRKYAQTFKYRMMRSIEDYKFRKKREKARKGQPRPVYKPPVRTPEETLRIQKQMKRLYKEYHVSMFEHCRRWLKEFIRTHKKT